MMEAWKANEKFFWIWKLLCKSVSQVEWRNFWETRDWGYNGIPEKESVRDLEEEKTKNSKQ